MKQNTYTAKNSGQKKRPADTSNRALIQFLPLGANKQQEHYPLRRHSTRRNHQLHRRQPHRNPIPLAIRLQTQQNTHDPGQQHYHETQAFLIFLILWAAPHRLNKFDGSQHHKADEYTKIARKSNYFLCLSSYFSTDKREDELQITLIWREPSRPRKCTRTKSLHQTR